jgi:hypothetical protein
MRRPCDRRSRIGSSLACALALAAAAAPAFGQGSLQPLADGELAEVRGSDGVAFNLVGFSLSGPLTLSYTAPDGASLSLANLALSRSDDPEATFSDPYRLRVQQREGGGADMVVLSEPANAGGLLKWQLAADWRVYANGSTFDGGALVLGDVVTRGGSLSLSTPTTASTDGFAFGLGVNLEVGKLALRARGRDDASEQLQLSGLRLGAASSDGTLLGTPWVAADVARQPGIINAVTDANGVSSLHIGIGWPTTAGAPLAGLVIDNVRFDSAALAGTQMDLGSSRIGTLQVQYLDVKLRGGL